MYQTSPDKPFRERFEGGSPTNSEIHTEGHDKLRHDLLGID